jgi:tRNA(fMet)-specific endonuclease VapC
VTTYLLDTNVCVEFLRQRNANVVRRITASKPDQLRVCSVVVAELYYGAHKSEKPAANVELLGRFLSQFVSLPVDDHVGIVAGQMRADLDRAGTPIGPNDLFIAAVGLVHGLTVVTHNLGEFTRVPKLVVETWE